MKVLVRAVLVTLMPFLPLQPAMADVGADGSTYVLTDFNGVATLKGLDDQGKTITGTYGATTTFGIAALNKYAPTDPCRIQAAAYNDYVAVNDSVGNFNGIIDLMVAGSCKARLLIDQEGGLKIFKPIP